MGASGYMDLRKIIILSLMLFLAANLSYGEESAQKENDYDLKIINEKLIENSDQKDEFKILDEKTFLPQDTQEQKHSKITNEQNLSLLSYDDLVHIYRDKTYKQNITSKIFSQPIVNNNISSADKDYPFKKCPHMGDYIRVSFWSIDGGKNYEQIEDVFFEPEKLTKKIDTKNSKMSYMKGSSITKKEAKQKVLEEANRFSQSDILMLNDADIGLARTDYKNTVDELATTLGYNYALIPEFLEIDPQILGVSKEVLDNENISPALMQPHNVDKEKLKAITAIAILSKFPLENVRVIRLHDFYDWYGEEKRNVFFGEKVKRYAAENVLNEKTTSHVRLGSRCALLADTIVDGEKITLLTVQFEDRTDAIHRAKQAKYLLEQIKSINNPVIVAGNFNTTTRNNAPVRPMRVIKNTFTDIHNLARFGVGLIFPPGLILNVTRPTIDYFRKSSDPTVKSIPIIAPNYERKVFNNFKKFTFDDGYRFDFRGDDQSQIQNFDPNGWLSNSNERAHVGFVPTYHINRNFGIANSKIDWMFIKGYRTDPFEKEGGSEKFAPHNARTLHTLNFAYKEPISRHAPLSVDLAITDFKNIRNAK